MKWNAEGPNHNNNLQLKPQEVKNSKIAILTKKKIGMRMSQKNLRRQSKIGRIQFTKTHPDPPPEQLYC